MTGLLLTQPTALLFALAEVAAVAYGAVALVLIMGAILRHNGRI